MPADGASRRVDDGRSRRCARRPHVNARPPAASSKGLHSTIVRLTEQGRRSGDLRRSSASGADRHRRRAPCRARMTAVQSTGFIAPDGTPSDEIGVMAGVLMSVSPRQRASARRPTGAPHRGAAATLGSAYRRHLACTDRQAEEDLVDVDVVPNRFAEVLTGLAVLGAGVVPVSPSPCSWPDGATGRSSRCCSPASGPRSPCNCSPSSSPTGGSSPGSTPTPTTSSKPHRRRSRPRR